MADPNFQQSSNYFLVLCNFLWNLTVPAWRLWVFSFYCTWQKHPKNRETKSARQKINHSHKTPCQMWKGCGYVYLKMSKNTWHNMHIDTTDSCLWEYFLSHIGALFSGFEITLMWWIVTSFSEYKFWNKLQPEEDETRTNKWNQEPLWQFHHM